MTGANATHRAFGLTWAMPFEFPVYQAVQESIAADVEVVEGSVPTPSAQAKWAGPLRAVEPGAVTFGMPGAGRMHLTGGNCIVLQQHEGATAEELRLLLMGPGAALILHQRGVLPLHGSGFVTDEGAVLILGHSGAGKSTVLGAFIERGFPVICDDLAAVHVKESGTPHVAPGTGVLKLWADAAAALGWDTAGLERVRPELAKFIVPLTHQVSEPVPVIAVYQLSTHNRPEVLVEPRQRTEKFKAILDHTWQKMTVKRMGLHGEHFRRAAALAAGVPVVAIRRPGHLSIRESGVVDAILADLRGRI